MKEKSFSLSGGIILGAGIALLGLAFRATSRDPEPVEVAQPTIPGHRDDLIDLGDIEQLIAVAGPAPDDGRTGGSIREREDCPHCGGSSEISPVNTWLVVFKGQPQYTMLVMYCYSKKCKGEKYTIDPRDSELQKFWDAGYQVKPRRESAPEAVVDVINSFWATPRTPDDTTPLQRQIHDVAIARAESETQLLDPDMA
jgi:hypothetical protein